MKIAALLARAKGRDFYDLMFLLSQSEPDYDFLSKRCGISNLQEFKQAAVELLKTVDLKEKAKDLNICFSIKRIAKKYYGLVNL